MSGEVERPSHVTGRHQPDAGTKGFKSGIRGREPIRLLIRFLLVILTAPIIGWMMGRAWVPGNELYVTSRQILANLLGLEGHVALSLVGLFGVGMYFALLLLFLFDVKKRIQGVLLLIGSVLALATTALMGVFLPNVEFTPLVLVGAVLGFLAGLFLESTQLYRLDVSQSSFRRPTKADGTIAEFRFAAKVIFLLVAGVVIASLVQVVLAAEVTVFDAPAAALFLVMLFRFIQYDSEGSYMTLGPGRSGKSMMLLGLCLELMRNADVHPNPNRYLQSGLERASNIRPGNEEWPIPSTPHDELRIASFEVIAGYYFPRRMELQALDYAGQHLGQVAEIFRSDRHRANAGTIPGEIADWVEAADTLLVILDIERLMFPEKFQDDAGANGRGVSWGLQHYGAVLENTDHDDVIIIATKCDILIDQNEVPSLAGYREFSTFRQDVTDYLAARPDVRQLLDLTGETHVQPVYFVTIKRNGEYLPKLDDYGNLMPVGYDHLIDEIRSRQ